MQPVAEQPPELSRRSRRTEGLSDKYFLYGEFGENQAFLRVRSSRLAFSLWCTVGRAACLPPQEPNVRLCISHRRKAAKNYSECVLSEVGCYWSFRNEQARSLQNIKESRNNRTTSNANTLGKNPLFRRRTASNSAPFNQAQTPCRKRREM